MEVSFRQATSRHSNETRAIAREATMDTTEKKQTYVRPELVDRGVAASATLAGSDGEKEVLPPNANTGGEGL